MKHWPFRVIQGEAARPKIQVEVKRETKTFFPEVTPNLLIDFTIN
jgi:hypothetical protein